MYVCVRVRVCVVTAAGITQQMMMNHILVHMGYLQLCGLTLFTIDLALSTATLMLFCASQYHKWLTRPTS